MAGTPKDLKGEYFKNPDDLFYAVDTAHEYVVICALFKYSNGYRGKVTASFRTLGRGLVERRQVIRIVEKFRELEFLVKTPRTPGKPNEITLNIDKILWYARKRMDEQTLSRKAIREMREEQRDAMTVRRAVEKPELLERAISGLPETTKTALFESLETKNGDQS